MTKSDRKELTDFMDEYGIVGKTWTERLENMISISLDKQEALVGRCHQQKAEIERLKGQQQGGNSWMPPAMMS